MKHSAKIFCCVSFTLFCCGQAPDKSSSVIQTEKGADKKRIINESGTTLQTRFNAPSGFERKELDQNSFANYLRNLPLKPAGSLVKYFNGDTKDDFAYIAVVHMDIGN